MVRKNERAEGLAHGGPVGGFSTIPPGAGAEHDAELSRLQSLVVLGSRMTPAARRTLHELLLLDDPHVEAFLGLVNQVPTSTSRRRIVEYMVSRLVEMA